MPEDCILIRNLKVRGTLGIGARERRKAQDILVSLDLYGDFRTAATSDSIEDCVDYAVVAEQVTALIGESSRYTVEALATDIARLLCTEYKRVSRVRVRLEKPQALTQCDTVGIEIERRPSDFLSAEA